MIWILGPRIFITSITGIAGERQDPRVGMRRSCHLGRPRQAEEIRQERKREGQAREDVVSESEARMGMRPSIHSHLESLA